jgi:type I restriction-modification system DNA methylase subunit
MVNLLFAEDDNALSTPGVVRTVFDPACGTGGCCRWPRIIFAPSTLALG